MMYILVTIFTALLLRSIYSVVLCMGTDPLMQVCVSDKTQWQRTGDTDTGETLVTLSTH